MTRDYARSSSNRRKPPATRKTPSRAAARQPKRQIWSAPSFSAGAIFGAALVLLASYAPTVFEDTVVAVREPPATQPDEIDFDFEEILTRGTVEADTSAYPAEFPEEDPNAPLPEYLIQAISVRSSETASALSAELTGAGLNARWERADLSSGTWYRVLVGPFHSRRDADRAMTELRRRNMSPRRIKVG